MMRRLVSFVVLFVVLVPVPVAQAGWSEFWHRVHVDFHRMNCWPQPFQQADKQVTISPLIAMTDAGWRLQNTLSDHFFDSTAQSLTRAGQMKVRWIATQAPLHRRSVFVLRGPDTESTAARVEAIHSYLQRLLPEGPLPEVTLTNTIPTGGSGDYFDEVDRQLKSSIPEPRLPEMQATSGGGG